MSDLASASAALSLRAYGRHRKELGLAGGNPVAVSRAIATQRLVSSVAYVDGDPKIVDAALADAEWARNTDLSRAPASVKDQAAGVTPSSVTSAAVTSGSVTQAKSRQRSPATSSLAAASAREKNARADLAELEFQEKAGRLVDAQAIEKEWTEIVTLVRTAVLSVTSKAKLAMPHLTHAHLATLNDLLCQALESVPERKPDSDRKADRNGAAA